VQQQAGEQQNDQDGSLDRSTMATRVNGMKSPQGLREDGAIATIATAAQK
jgi:hypothetical protein